MATVTLQPFEFLLLLFRDDSHWRFEQHVWRDRRLLAKLRLAPHGNARRFAEVEDRIFKRLRWHLLRRRFWRGKFFGGRSFWMTIRPKMCNLIKQIACKKWQTHSYSWWMVNVDNPVPSSWLFWVTLGSFNIYLLKIAIYMTFLIQKLNYPSKIGPDLDFKNWCSLWNFGWDGKYWRSRFVAKKRARGFSGS